MKLHAPMRHCSNSFNIIALINVRKEVIVGAGLIIALQLRFRSNNMYDPAAAIVTQGGKKTLVHGGRSYFVSKMYQSHVQDRLCSTLWKWGNLRQILS